MPRLAAEVDDVPDDQEVAGEIELLDQIELARDLRARAVVKRTIAIARADVGNLAEERHLRLPRRHRIVGEAIAEIGHRVSRRSASRACAATASGRSAKSSRHRLRRLQIALGVPRQPPAGACKRRLVPQAREHVEQRPLRRRGEAHAAGGDERHPERRRQRRERLRCRAPHRAAGAAAAPRTSDRGRRCRRHDRAGRRRRSAAHRARPVPPARRDRRRGRRDRRA